MRTAAALFVSALLLGSLSTACKSRPVTAEEKQLLPTAESLQPWLDEDAELDAATGKFTKVYALGSHELEYEYESEYLYFNSGIHVESDDAEARSTFAALGLGLNVGIGLEDIEKRACDEEVSLGEQSRCELLQIEGITIGHYLMVRDGRRVFFVIIGGAALEPGELAELIKPYLDGMGGYDPSLL